LLVIVDRYYSAAQILGDAVKSAELPLNVEPLEIALTNYENSYLLVPRKQYDDNLTGYLAFSGPAKDLYKNCALAWMRLHAVSKLLPQLNDRLTALSQDKKITVRCNIFYLSSSFVSCDHLF